MTGPARRQRGVAIVLAMGVVAVAVAAAAVVLQAQGTWFRLDALRSDRAQARALVESGVDWARAVLFEDRRSGSADHAGEPWAARLDPVPVDGGDVAGRIVDLQGAFNVNNLVRDGKVVPAELLRFRRLLAVLALPPHLADALADWLDADGDVRPGGGAEDGYYAALDPPYLAANRPLTDVADLALVRGFDDNVRARLGPFVAALPRPTPVNVNTAPAEVLFAVLSDVDLETARALVAQRERAYFASVGDFARRLPGAGVSPVAGLAVASDHFLVTVRARIGESSVSGTALLVRDGPGWPSVAWRRIP
jgi:general secretion pathway protein K